MRITHTDYSSSNRKKVWIPGKIKVRKTSQSRVFRLLVSKLKALSSFLNMIKCPSDENKRSLKYWATNLKIARSLMLIGRMGKLNHVIAKDIVCSTRLITWIYYNICEYRHSIRITKLAKLRKKYILIWKSQKNCIKNFKESDFSLVEHLYPPICLTFFFDHKKWDRTRTKSMNLRWRTSPG